MADDVEDLDLVIEPEKVPEPKVVTPEEGIEALKAKLAEADAAQKTAEAARSEAERRAQAAAMSASTARTEKRDSEKALVENAIGQLTGQQDLLESNLAAAASAGDWVEHAKFQRQMSDNSARLAQLEAGKTQMEARAKEPDVVPITDPVESLAMQLSPRSAAWVRLHPEYARDQRLTQRMIAAHNLAVTDNLTPDTDDYFASIETILGVRKVAPEPESALSEAARREAPPSPAPARRDANGTRVTISAAEREMAEVMGMSPEDYAKNKQLLKQEGRLN